MNAQSARADVGREAVRDAWALAQQACAAAGVAVHEVQDAPGCRGVLDLLNVIWGTAETDVLDLGFMVALAHAGNLVIRADDGDRPIGAAVGFNGPPESPFHSHIVGVVPGMHGRGVGRAIKLYQRAWCLERGLRVMAWTYDPLVARNAYFNLRRLGARATAYHPDFYGSMRDTINAGQRSDRMVATWDLTVPPAAVSSAPELEIAHGAGAVDSVVVDATTEDPVYAPPAEGAAGPVLIGIPRDIEQIRITDPELAQRWRTATREAFTDLLGRGWVISDFTRSGCYLLTDPSAATKPTERNP